MATAIKKSELARKRTRVDTNRQGQQGVAWVQWIVEGLWLCGLEVISAHNDDGVDAVILLKRRLGLKAYAGPTGDLIFVQIKTGYVPKAPVKDYQLELGEDHIQRHRIRWAAYPGPAIMINVIPRRLTGGDPVAYWTNLKSNAVSQDGKVSFSITNTFDLKAKSAFYNLCWRWAEFRKLVTIRAGDPIQGWPGEPQFQLFSSDRFIQTAKDYYLAWRDAARTHPHSFIASISRRGWEHITRLARPTRTKQQSLLLLPVAARMLASSSNADVKRLTPIREQNLPCGQVQKRWYEGVTARVSFYERHEAVVRVVLERTQLTDVKGTVKHDARQFYSIYEIARRRHGI